MRLEDTDIYATMGRLNLIWSSGILLFFSLANLLFFESFGQFPGSPVPGQPPSGALGSAPQVTQESDPNLPSVDVQIMPAKRWKTSRQVQ